MSIIEEQKLPTILPRPSYGKTRRSLIRFGNKAGKRDIRLGAKTINVFVGDDIQKTIDALNKDGGGRLFIKNGTHKLSNNLVMYSNIYIQGENAGSAILDFQNNAYGIQIVGTNAYTTGTLTVTNNSQTVTGSSTVWTSAMIGRKILLDGLWYTISAVASNTSLTISAPFAGVTLVAGTSYTIATLKEDVKITDLTIKNASSGIKFQYTNEVFIRDVDVQASVTGIDADDSSQCSLNEIDLTANNNGIIMDNSHFVYFAISGAVDTLAGNGMTLTNVTNSSLTGIFLMNSSADGLNMTDCSNVKIDGTFIENGGQGIEFVSGNSDIVISQSAVENNGSDGIKYTASSDNCFLFGISIKNNGAYGLNVADSTSDNLIISICNFASNTSGAVNDLGTGTLIRSNIGVVDN